MLRRMFPASFSKPHSGMSRVCEPQRGRPIWTSNATPSVEERTFGDDLRAVESRYSLRNRERVRAFLCDNPYLVPLLVELPKAVDRTFGSGTPVALQRSRFSTPGSDDTLEAMVQVDAAVGDVLDRLHAFDEAWWIDRVPLADGRLDIHVEYR